MNAHCGGLSALYQGNPLCSQHLNCPVGLGRHFTNSQISFFIIIIFFCLQAAEYYKQAAEMGHAQSIFNLALMTLNGEGGVIKDKSVGLELMNKAADQGLPQVHLSLTGNSFILMYTEEISVLE
jgi:TPR repeat protein